MIKMNALSSPFLIVATLLAVGCSAAPAETETRSAAASSFSQNATCSSGAERNADDGCNTCTCVNGGWECTELACEDSGDQGGADRRGGDRTGGTPADPPGGSAPGGPGTSGDPDDEEVSSEDGPACAEGETIPAADGCNTCSCSGGEWWCTELSCE